MTKPKTLDQLRAEKERAETQLAQEQHKLNRLENRKKYLEKGERQKRTHRLCNLGGTIESLAPEVKDLTRTEMTELMEHIFSLSEVQRAVPAWLAARYRLPIFPYGSPAAVFLGHDGLECVCGADRHSPVSPWGAMCAHEH